MQGYHVGDSDGRPWGRWEVIAVGADYVIKQIDVKPGSALSLQRHQHRDEVWCALEGSATVTVGESERPFTKDQQLFIPRGSMHRLVTAETESIRFIEIQTGDVLDEADIERFDDRYGRSDT